MQNDHQQAQASWMQRMVTSLFSDSTLFNTREGRAGKVHNFMLGLNLNTSIPFSPFSEVLTNHPEEEVDAVTGNQLAWSENPDVLCVKKALGNKKFSSTVILLEKGKSAHLFLITVQV